MDVSNAFSEASTQIGEEPRPYAKSLGPKLFSESLLTDNTLKQIPTESQKTMLTDLITISSACYGLLFGFPKSHVFNSKVCLYGEAASSYDFYVRCIILHLKILPKYLDVIVTKLNELSKHVSTEDEFFQICISLIKVTNFISFLSTAADGEAKRFTDYLNINPISDQINTICASVRQLIGMADQARSSIASKQFQETTIPNLKSNFDILTNAIPNYVSSYSQLLDHLKSYFILLYNENETGFQDFLIFLRNLITPIHEIVLFSIETFLYSVENGTNLLTDLNSLMQNVFLLISSSIKLTRFRSSYTENVKASEESHPQISTYLNKTINDLILLLGYAPPIYQNVINEILTERFQNFINLDNQFSDKFKEFLNLIKTDKKSVLFSPVSMVHSSSPLSVISLPAIKLTHKIASKLMESEFDILPEMTKLTPIIINLMENIDLSIDKTTQSMYRRQLLLQKKIKIQNSLRKLIDSLYLLQSNQDQPLLQSKCGLIAIDLCHSLMYFETHSKFFKYLKSEKQILLKFSLNYFNERISFLPKLLNSLYNNLEIPQSYDKVIKDILSSTETIIENSLNSFNKLNEINNNELETSKILITEYINLFVPLRSIQLIFKTLKKDEKYTLVYNIIDNYIQIFRLFVEVFKSTITLQLYHQTIYMFKYVERFIPYMQLLSTINDKQSNIRTRLEDLLNHSKKEKMLLNKMKVLYDPKSVIKLIPFVKRQIQFYSNFNTDLLSQFKSKYFESNYDESVKRFNSIIGELKNSFEFSPILDINLTKSNANFIGPIIYNSNQVVNYYLKEFMDKYEVDNKETAFIAYDLVQKLFDLALITSVINNAENISTALSLSAPRIYEFSLISALGDKDSYKKAASISKFLINILKLLVPITKSLYESYLIKEEIVTEIPSEKITEMSGEKVTEMPSEKVTEIPSEIVHANELQIQASVFSNLLNIQKQISKQSNQQIEAEKENEKIQTKVKIVNDDKEKQEITPQKNRDIRKENEILNQTIEKMNEEETNKLRNEYINLKKELENLKMIQEKEKEKLSQIENEKRTLKEKANLETKKRKIAEVEMKKIQDMIKQQNIENKEEKEKLEERLKIAEINLQKQKEIERQNRISSEKSRIDLQIEKEKIENELYKVQKNIEQNKEEENRSKTQLNQRLQEVEEAKNELEIKLKNQIMNQKIISQKKEEEYKKLLEKLQEQNDEKQKEIMKAKIEEQQRIIQESKEQMEKERIEIENKIKEQEKINQILIEERKKRQEAEEQQKIIEEEKIKAQKEAEIFKDQLQAIKLEKEKIKNEAENQRKHLLQELEEKEKLIQKENEKEKEKQLKEIEEEKQRIHLEMEKEKERLLKEIQSEKERIKREAEEEKERVLKEAHEEKQKILESKENVTTAEPKLFEKSVKFTQPSNFDATNHFNTSVNPVFGPFEPTTLQKSEFKYNTIFGESTLVDTPLSSERFLPEKDSPFFKILEPMVSKKVTTLDFSTLQLEPPKYQFGDEDEPIGYAPDLTEVNDLHDEEEDLLFPDPFGDNDFDDDDDFYDSIYDLTDDDEEEEELPFPFPFPPPKN